jgi:ParB family chromosome partitioning protein
LDGTADEKLTGLALRLVLSDHVGIAREGEFDFLTEAAIAFVSPQCKKKAATKNAKRPFPINAVAKDA